MNIDSTHILLLLKRGFRVGFAEVCWSIPSRLNCCWGALPNPENPPAKPEAADSEAADEVGVNLPPPPPSGPPALGAMDVIEAEFLVS